MKIAVNETATTVILANGRLKLDPKGTPKDRKDVPKEVAEHPDVVRFAKLGKISLLSAEGASQRELQENKATAAAKVEEKKAKTPEPKAKVEEKKVEAPKVEETKAETPKVEESKVEEPEAEKDSDDDDESDEKSGRKKKKRGGRR